MAALKELKGRINSVQNTLKITSTMKMVSSAKLHRVQALMEALARYENRFTETVAALCSDPDVVTASPLYLPHKELRHAVVIALASDSSLCGAFNANAVRQLESVLKSLISEGFSKITICPIGEKMVQAVVRPAFAARFAPALEINLDYRHLAGKYSFDGIAPLATQLMQDYIADRNDRVCMVYNHFRSMGHQVPVTDQLLPFKEESVDNAGREAAHDYILEPGPDELLAALLPSATRIRLYRVLLDSVTAENAARMIAMQTATDNAQELIDDLSLEYNKRRQQAITAELADITSSLQS